MDAEKKMFIAAMSTVGVNSVITAIAFWVGGADFPRDNPLSVLFPIIGFILGAAGVYALVWMWWHRDHSTRYH